MYVCVYFNMTVSRLWPSSTDLFSAKRIKYNIGNPVCSETRHHTSMPDIIAVMDLSEPSWIKASLLPVLKPRLVQC